MPDSEKCSIKAGSGLPGPLCRGGALGESHDSVLSLTTSDRDLGPSNFLQGFSGGVRGGLGGEMKEDREGEREAESSRCPRATAEPHGKCNWKGSQCEPAGSRIKGLESASPGFELPPPLHGCMKLPKINHLSEIVFSCIEWG